MNQTVNNVGTKAPSRPNVAPSLVRTTEAVVAVGSQITRHGQSSASLSHPSRYHRHFAGAARAGETYCCMFSLPCPITAFRLGKTTQIPSILTLHLSACSKVTDQVVLAVSVNAGSGNVPEHLVACSFSTIPSSK